MSEEVPSVNLVDSAEIISEFLDAGVKIKDENVIESLKKMSIEYNLTPADLYAQWLSYTTKNPAVNVLDAIVCEELQARIHQSRIKAAQHSSIKAKYVPKIKPKIDFDILETYVSLGNVKKESLVNESKENGHKDGEPEILPDVIKSEPVDEPMEQDAQISLSTETGVAKFSAVMVKKEKSDDSEEIVETGEIEPDEDDHLFKKEVLCDFGRKIPSKAWLAVKKDRSLNISPFDHTRHLSTEEKFFDSNIDKCTEVMDRVFDKQRDEFIKSTSTRNIKIGIFDEVEPGEATYFGRVRMDIKDEFDERLIFLHEFRSTKNSFQLDLSRVKDFSLFPGQSVEVCGDADTKRSIRATEITDASYLIRPFPSPPKFTQLLNIVTASGPFHLPNSDDFTPLKNLLEYVAQYKPNVLILFGPIIEMTPSMFDLFSFSLFNDALTMISEKLSGAATRIIVVSSPKEWHTSPVFPTPPYNGFWSDIEFYPCPSFIDINGLIIGLSSVDITLHLTKNLIESRGASETGNRIKRILRHILVQNSLYPLYPSSDEVTFETPKLEYCRFTTTPHLIVLPSVLRNFIHSIEGCVFVNPEKVRKNTIGRIQIAPVDNRELPGSIELSITAQIIKI